MGKVCEFAVKMPDDMFYCNKYNSYCYLDNPDRKQCINIYGDNYTEEDGEADLYEDEENVEDSL